MAQTKSGRVSVLIEPTLDPVPLQDQGGVKHHLRVDHSYEDTDIRNAMRAAAGEIDAPHGWLGRSLMSRTLRLTIDAYPPTTIYLPGPPVTEIKKITVRDSDDAFTDIYDSDLAVDTINLQSDLTAEPALIWADPEIGWPTDINGGVDSMRIDYVAGYATQDDIPMPIRQWILMRTGELYRDREGSVLMVASNRLHHADRMLDAWRVRF